MLQNRFLHCFGRSVVRDEQGQVAVDRREARDRLVDRRRSLQLQHCLKIKLGENAERDKKIKDLDKKVKRQIEADKAIFKEKGIPYAVFDVKPVLDRYNALLIEDKISTTPTSVIIKSWRKKVFVGGPDVINALKSLQ